MSAASGGISINIDQSRLNEIRVLLNALPRHVEAAFVSTLGRLTGWLRTQIRRQLVRWMGIPNKVLKKRVVKTRVFRSGGQISARVWIGTMDAALVHFRARQNAAGVTSSRTGTIRSAFITRGAGGKRHVFKRTGASRYPIKVVVTELDREMNRVIDSVLSGGAFENQFYTRFAHELTWRMNRNR